MVPVLSPLFLIVVGIAVLLLGKRLAVLGAAVGALVGVLLLRLFPGTSGPWVTLGVPVVLAVIGFFVAGFAKGLIDIIVLVVGALAGAAIVLGFLDLFNLGSGLMSWLLAVVGGVVGLVLIRRARKGSKDWGIIILAGLVGALLVTRGLTALLPSLQGVVGTIIVLVLAAASIVYQGELLGGKAAATATAVQPSAPAAVAPPPTDTPPSTPTAPQ